LATTVSEHTCHDAEIVRAYRDQTTPVEPGCRWIKNPAASSPVWLDKRERIAALALRTVVGLLVYGVIQRQVRQYLQQRHESIPGNKGETATPTATVVFESFASVTLVYLDLDGTIVSEVHGWQAHHRLICKALGLSDTWYDDVANRKNNRDRKNSRHFRPAAATARLHRRPLLARSAGGSPSTPRRPATAACSKAWRG
jgi:hypothetical protein